MITRYYRELFNYCLRKVKDPETAADIAQESYARLLSVQQAGQTVIDPRSLLKKVALHLKIDLDRRAEVRQHDDIDALDETNLPASPVHLQPDEILASHQAARAYLEVIEALPPRCKEAFCMYAFDEMPNKEIARRMGVSLSMVDQYIRRAKLACAARRAELEGSRDVT
ncbi:MAG: RNA polymerase sigma factor [Burkholderiaceae bacterium]